MKLVVLDGHGLNPGDLSWDCLKEFGEVTVYEEIGTFEENVARIGDADVILMNKTPITKELLDACPSVRLICELATGFNNIDCKAARERGIPVCNVPDYGTSAVAQFTFALLLELCHRVGYHDRVVHEGKWAACPNFCFWDTPQMELAGKTIGIIGFGRIGQAVGKIANAFGMHVLAYSRSIRSGAEAIGEYVDLDTLLEKSDIISLHCPLTPENTGMIGAEAIAKMKTGAILLNTARGQLIDETALAEALKENKLRAAAVDVVSREPILENNPLLKAPNCIITPHMAWAPVESRQRILDCTMRSIHAYLDGNPFNVVN